MSIEGPPRPQPHGGKGASSSLTFFVELPGSELGDLLQPSVLDLLRRRDARLSMAMLDLSDQRKDALLQLNRAGIPVTAWLVLPESQGYWLTADNASAGLARGREVLAWARDHEIALDGLGLDIEPPHADTVDLVRRPLRTIWRLLRSRRSDHHLDTAAATYAQLADQARGAGVRVEAYHLPFLDDDRQARSKLIRRSLGLVDLHVDREVWMLYRSAVPWPFGPGLVDAYGRAAPAIGVGITGGGVRSLQASFAGRELDGPSVVDELRAAAQYTADLYVFSLEGCVRRGILQHVCEVDLSAPPLAGRSSKAMRTARWTVQWALRTAGTIRRSTRRG